MNQFNEMIVDENDLVEGLLQGKQTTKIVTKDLEKINDYNHFCSLFKIENVIDYETPSQEHSDKYSYKNAENWNMPDEYRQLNIIDHLLSKTQDEEQYQRVVKELEEFEKRDMFPMLQFLVYMVDELKHKNIMWGVGRGSSVSSYILYLIGVHKIDSIKYDLDYKEFLR